MKRFIFSFLALVLMLLVAACSDNGSEKLAKACEEMNTICPVNVPMVGTVNSFTVEDSMLVIVCDVTNKDLSYDILKADENNVRNQIKPAIANMTRGKFFDLLREANAGICYRYQWQDGKSLDIPFTFEELEEIAK